MTPRGPRVTQAAAMFAAALASSAVSAADANDFQSALGNYHAGRYEAAHTQFLALAELGNCSAQFNLAAMALHGQGSPRDAGVRDPHAALELAKQLAAGDIRSDPFAALRP